MQAQRLFLFVGPLGLDESVQETEAGDSKHRGTVTSSADVTGAHQDAPISDTHGGHHYLCRVLLYWNTGDALSIGLVSNVIKTGTYMGTSGCGIESRGG